MDITKIDELTEAIQKVNHSLKSLTLSLSGLKEVSPELFDKFKEALHKVSGDE